MNNRDFSKLSYIISVVLLLFSCNSTNNKSRQSQEQKHNNATIELCSSSIVIQHSFWGKHRTIIDALGVSYSVLSTGERDTIDVAKLVGAYKLAYNLVKQSSVTLSVKVDDNQPNTFILSKTGTLKESANLASLVSGNAAKLSSQSETATRAEVRKWLYSSQLPLSDTEISEMLRMVNSFSYTEHVFWIQSGIPIPIIRSFAGQRYSVNTTQKADYYYLFATDRGEDIEEFIAEVVGLDFINANRSTTSLECFRPKEKKGLLTLFLIGINKDWSKFYIPIGVVALDNSAPVINKSMTTYKQFQSALEKQSDSPEVVAFNSNAIKVIIKDKLSLDTLTGSVDISTMEFRGDDAKFVVKFTGDIDYITIKRELHSNYSRYYLKPEIKKIVLSDKQSPYYFTYTLDLAIGDNYIPISATDKRGNTSEIMYNIHMVPIDDDNPTINIDNNVNVNVR